MVHYGKYRTKSWSQLAREFADRMMEGCEYEVMKGRETYEGAHKFMITTLQSSYRNPLIISRAAKRIGRKWKH